VIEWGNNKVQTTVLLCTDTWGIAASLAGGVCDTFSRLGTNPTSTTGRKPAPSRASRYGPLLA